MEHGQDFFLFMSSPPLGRERFAIAPTIIDKVKMAVDTLLLLLRTPYTVLAPGQAFSYFTHHGKHTAPLFS